MDATVLAAVALVAAALIGLAVAPVTATVRAALLFGACALTALVTPGVALFAAVAVVAAFVVDALVSRSRPVVHRHVPGALARGVASSLTLDADRGGAGSLRLRQPLVPDIAVDPAEADGRLDARVRAGRRGRHTLPSPAARVRGPLGLAAWYRRGGDATEVLVYPDLPAAWRLVLAVRQGRFRDPGRLTRGPLGLGTDFESIRDYLPDDDIRQVNWRATARLGRPMSNQYRVEQDRDVVCLLDTGRLMAAPLGDRTRLDATVDAATAVALVADEVGDRAGVIAFDAQVRRRLPPARGGGDAVVRAVFDVEPTMVDSDYELAFRAVGSGKRAFVLVLTDLLEEAAAQPLIDAMPVLARRHAVVVASVADPDLEQMVHAPPQSPADVYAAAVALDVLDARARVAAQLRRAGADVFEARPDLLPNACVGAYLRAKARARL
ncbi:MAG TPA: DUF58 domain-containing protein [Acidimicrobiia bacterium]|nr:DUF58 domain-containing protein [Acidimicrobiia bacterium]